MIRDYTVLYPTRLSSSPMISFVLPMLFYADIHTYIHTYIHVCCVLIVHACAVRLCPCTLANNWPTLNLSRDIHGEPCWDDTDRGKPKNSEKTCPIAGFVHHKSHMDRLGYEPIPPK
jgi:hypothetical protein